MTAEVRRAARRLDSRWTAQVADHVMAVEWVGGGAGLAVGDASGGLTIFDITSGEVRLHREAHAFGLTGLACDPGEGRVATCGQDGMVRVWSPAGDTVLELDAGAPWVERVRWSHDGQFLASAAARRVRIWTRAGELVREYPNHRATVTDIQWHPAEHTLCSTSYGGVTLITPGQAEPLKTLSWQGSSLIARWSPSGRYIATAEQDSTVHFWIVRTGSDLQMSGYPTKVRCLAWGPKGRVLATGGGHEATLWDCSGAGPAGRRPLTLPGHEQPVTALGYQHRGQLLASGGADGRVVVWNPTRPKKLVGAVLLAEPVSDLSWSPDDTGLAVGGARGLVDLLATPEP